MPIAVRKEDRMMKAYTNGKIYTVNENGLMIDKPGTGGWTQAWYVFAMYALVVAIVFAILFRYKHTSENKT